MIENPTTAVLLSGGMNSATALLELVRLKRRPVLEALIFDTDSSTPEWSPARAMANRAGVSASLWNLHLGPYMDIWLEAQPDSLVPFGDVKLFWTEMFISAAYRAKQRGYQRIVTGHLKEELSIPEEEMAEAWMTACRLSRMPEDLFEFPLWDLSKASVFLLARDISALGEITFYTASCLNGDDTTKQSPWGFGCGECPGCLRRAAAWKGYAEASK